MPVSSGLRVCERPNADATLADNRRSFKSGARRDGNPDERLPQQPTSAEVSDYGFFTPPQF